MILNIFLIIIIILSLSIIVCYNNFIRKDNAINEAISTIDILLKKRFDLLPNIIECVKGYTKHEKETFKELTALRTSYNNNEFSIKEAEDINKKFSTIMILSENYPELKANEQFLSLQNKLIEIEDEINDARTIYNRRVTKFNNYVQTVPSNIIAKIFDFQQKELFKVNKEEKENIKINL